MRVSSSHSGVSTPGISTVAKRLLQGFLGAEPAAARSTERAFGDQRSRRGRGWLAPIVLADGLDYVEPDQVEQRERGGAGGRPRASCTCRPPAASIPVRSSSSTASNR